MVNVEIRQLNHRGRSQIGIYFKYNEELLTPLRKLGCAFSSTHCCWYIENTEKNKQELIKILEQRSHVILKKTEEDKLDNSTNLRVELCDEYLEELVNFGRYLRSKKYGVRTIEVYVVQLQQFLGYCKGKPLRQIDNSDIRNFNYDILFKRGYSASYYRQMAGSLKNFFLRIVGTKVDVDLMERPRREKKLPVVLSWEEVSAILMSIENIKHKAIVGLLYASGLRISELLSLKISDVDSTRMLIRVEQAKGRKDRYVSLSINILQVLREYFKEHVPYHYLFNGPVKGEKYSETSIRKVLAEACKKAGIRKRVSPHTLRHSYATHLIENGVNLRYVQEMLGHRKPETTMIYTHVTRKSIMEIQSPLDYNMNIDLRQTNPENLRRKMLKGEANRGILGVNPYF